MVKLTKLEKLFLQTHIDRFGQNDGSNCIHWDIAVATAKLCNISIKSLRGVFGSLEKKGIITQDGIDYDFTIKSGWTATKNWYFNLPVCADNYPVATIEFIEKTINDRNSKEWA